MKQFIRIYISMALFVLFGVSAYAGGKVEVADDVSNGTITGQVNGTQVTLTVTPDPGYYIRKTDIIAEKTFMPLAASRRSIPMNDRLEIVGDDPDDLSQPRTYTVTLPSEEYDVLVHANFQLRGGKAEVNDAILNGTVVASVDQLTMTVTVTPSDGYYIRKEDVIVSKTFMPAATSRRAAPVADHLTLTGEDPDDLSQPRTYTAQLPGWEYSAYVDATFTKRKDITSAMVNLSASSFVYNGSDQKPVVTVTGLTEGKDYLLDFAGTSWSDVGTYSLTVTGRSTWKSVVTKTYTITKAPSVVTAVPEPLSLTYSGVPQTLIAAGDAIGGTLLYSLDNSSYQTTLPTGTAAGSYTVYYKVQGDSNHQDTEAKTVTVTIAKKAITISGIIAQDKVYDRSTVATLVYDGVVYGGIVDGDALTITAKGTFADVNVDTNKNVTITELRLGGTSIANYQLAAEGQQTTAMAAITPRSIEGAVLSDITAKSYTGEPLNPTVSVTLDGTTLTADTDYRIAYANNVNVGEATIAVTGIGNYQGTVQTTFTITSVVSVVLTAPQPQTLVYSGESQQLVTGGEVEGGTLVYSLDGETFTAELPNGKDAGVYTVYYKVQGDSNHKDTEAKTMTVTTAKKTITISGIIAQDKVYDRSTVATLVYDSVVYGGIVEGDALTVTAKGTFANANVGTNKEVSITELTLGGTSIANYQLAAEGQQTTATAAITPRSIEGATIADIPSATYTGDPLTPTVSVTLDGTTLTADTDYQVAYTNNVNVGEATLFVTGIGNYQANLQTSFAIVPAMAQVVTAPEGRTLLYNGTEQELVRAGEADGGTLVYSLDGTTYAAALPMGKIVNGYTISYKVQGDANHNDTEPVTIESTIDKAAIIISGITAQDKVYDGTTIAMLVYDQVVYDGIVSGDELTVTAKGTFADANAATGKNVTITELTLGGTSIANYQLAETGQQATATATITPRSIEGAVLSDITAKSYTGEPLNPTVSVTLDGTTLTADTDYLIAYANNVNVGEATIAVTGIGNYQGTVQTTFTITSVVSVVVTAPQPQTLVYSGESQQLVRGGEVEGGTMVYSLDGTDYQPTIPTGVDAKTYTVYYKVQSDSNHTDSESASVSVTIGPKEVLQPTVLLGTIDYTYDGTAKEPDVTVMDGETVIAASEYTVDYANNINAGEATVTITDGEGGNYMVNGTASFIISKAPSVITQDPQPLALDYTGEEQTLVMAGEAEGGTLVYSLDSETFTAELPNGKDAGVYTVYYKLQGDNNHTDTEVYTLKSSITPTLVDESGTEVDADFIEGDGGDIEVVINTLPENFWEDTSVIPSAVSDEKGNEYDVTKVGAQAFEEMPTDIIVVLPEGMSTTEGVTNVVNGDGTCETLDLTEVSGYNVPIDVEVEEVVYEREVTEGSTTVCLPYDLPVPENTTAYALDDTDSEGVTMKECEGILEANQPYVLVVDETSDARRRAGDDASFVINLGASNVTISHAVGEGSVVKNNFTLCGTVHSMTHEEGLAKKAYVMQPDKSWRMTASSDPAMAKEQYLAPFQSYLLYTGEGEMVKVSTTFESSTTGVLTVKTSTPQSSKDGWYDLMGRKLPGKPREKGLYIYQGRKVYL